MTRPTWGAGHGHEWRRWGPVGVDASLLPTRAPTNRGEQSWCDVRWSGRPCRYLSGVDSLRGWCWGGGSVNISAQVMRQATSVADVFTVASVRYAHHVAIRCRTLCSGADGVVYRQMTYDAVGTRVRDLAAG